MSIHEKERISPCASSGVYGVGSGSSLLRAIENLVRTGKSHNGDYYVGPALNQLRRLGGRIYPAKTFAKFDLGSPKGIQSFSRLAVHENSRMIHSQ